MPKQLYPKAPRPIALLPQKEDPWEKPFHVYYYDPDNPTAIPEWKHYDSLSAVKADAWYQVRLLGFNTAAILYTRDELLQMQGELEHQPQQEPVE